MAMARVIAQRAFTTEETLVEVPQVYRASRSRGDPNDLITLALVAGAIFREASDPIEVNPRQWKGTLDGDKMVERIQGRLSPEETATVILPSAKSLHHNVWDAVGIGLWKLCRLARKRVYAR